jgi:IclR family pca regulon transcriptional regulator
MSNELRDSEYLYTLERGLTVLRSFDSAHPTMKLSEVAARTGLSPAVARRCLNTLIKLGYVGQHDRNFLLKPKVLEFGSAFSDSMNFDHIATPYLQALRDETGDSASLAVISGKDIMYLVHVSTNRRIRLGAHVGTRFPAHATSLGRAIWAFMPSQSIDAYLKNCPLQKLTENTLVDRKALSDRLQKIRQLGYETAQDELDYGIISIAVPIYDSERRVIAAINCSTTTSRISRKDIIASRLDPLRLAASEIELSLKRWPYLAQALRDMR